MLNYKSDDTFTKKYNNFPCQVMKDAPTDNNLTIIMSFLQNCLLAPSLTVALVQIFTGPRHEAFSSTSRMNSCCLKHVLDYTGQRRRIEKLPKLGRHFPTWIPVDKFPTTRLEECESGNFHTPEHSEICAKLYSFDIRRGYGKKITPTGTN